MNLPPDASPAVRAAFLHLERRLDAIGASEAPNQNLAGNRVTNAGDALQDRDYVTLQQMETAIAAARRAARAEILAAIRSAALATPAPTLIKNVPDWVGEVIGRIPAV